MREIFCVSAGLHPKVHRVGYELYPNANPPGASDSENRERTLPRLMRRGRVPSFIIRAQPGYVRTRQSRTMAPTKKSAFGIHAAMSG